MPNHCYNRIKIKGERKYVEKFVKDNTDEKGNLTFRKILPPPDDRMLDTTEGFNDSGYEWARDNWGTKWDAYDQSEWDFEEDGDDYIAIKEFHTAWSPPEGVIFAYFETYPHLRICVHYEEAGMGYFGDFESGGDDEYVENFREAQSSYEWENLRGG